MPFYTHMTYTVQICRAGCTETLIEHMHKYTGNVDDLVDGMTALMVASGQGHIDTMATLMLHGASVDVKGPGGYTALFVACMRGQKAAVALLLTSGADPNIRVGVNHLTPLYVTLFKGHDNGIASLLVGRGADVHAETCYGVTALWVASANGALKAVKTLVRRGASVTCCNSSGKQALAAACINGHLNVARFLQLSIRRNRLESM